MAFKVVFINLSILFSNIVCHFWNILTYSISAIDNQLDSFAKKYLKYRE